MKSLVAIAVAFAALFALTMPTQACNTVRSRAFLAPGGTCSSASAFGSYGDGIGLARTRALTSGYSTATLGTFGGSSATFDSTTAGYDDIGTLADAGLTDADLAYLDTAGVAQRQAFFGRAYGAVRGRALAGRYARGRGIFGRGLGVVARGVGGVARFARRAVLRGAARAAGVPVRNRGQQARNRGQGGNRGGVARQGRQGGNRPAARQGGRPGNRNVVARNRGGARPGAARGGRKAGGRQAAPVRGRGGWR